MLVVVVVVEVEVLVVGLEVGGLDIPGTGGKNEVLFVVEEGEGEGDGGGEEGISGLTSANTTVDP